MKPIKGWAIQVRQDGQWRFPKYGIDFYMEKKRAQQCGKNGYCTPTRVVRVEIRVVKKVKT